MVFLISFLHTFPLIFRFQILWYNIGYEQAEQISKI